jgi:hypothetical protein
MLAVLLTTLVLLVYFYKNHQISLIIIRHQFMRIRSIVLVSALLLIAQCSYNHAIASDLVHFSSITYEPQDSIDAWNCADCKNYEVKSQKSFHNAPDDIQGLTAYYPKLNAIVIAFGDSTDIKDLI